MPGLVVGDIDGLESSSQPSPTKCVVLHSSVVRYVVREDSKLFSGVVAVSQDLKDPDKVLGGRELVNFQALRSDAKSAHDWKEIFASIQAPNSSAAGFSARASMALAVK